MTIYYNPALGLHVAEYYAYSIPFVGYGKTSFSALEACLNALNTFYVTHA